MVYIITQTTDRHSAVYLTKHLAIPIIHHTILIIILQERLTQAPIQAAVPEEEAVDLTASAEVYHQDRRDKKFPFSNSILIITADSANMCCHSTVLS